MNEEQALVKRAEDGALALLITQAQRLDSDLIIARRAYLSDTAVRVHLNAALEFADKLVYALKDAYDAETRILRRKGMHKSTPKKKEKHD